MTNKIVVSKGIVASKRIYFRPISSNDIDNGWMDWVNDPVVNKFLDSKKDVVWDIGEQQWLGILESNLKTFEKSFDDDEQERYYKTIKKHTKLLDLNRGQHIKDYIPELEKFIYE